MDFSDALKELEKEFYNYLYDKKLYREKEEQKCCEKDAVLLLREKILEVLDNSDTDYMQDLMALELACVDRSYDVDFSELDLIQHFVKGIQIHDELDLEVK